MAALLSWAIACNTGEADVQPPQPLPLAEPAPAEPSSPALSQSDDPFAEFADITGRACNRDHDEVGCHVNLTILDAACGQGALDACADLGLLAAVGVSLTPVKNSWLDAAMEIWARACESGHARSCEYASERYRRRESWLAQSKVGPFAERACRGGFDDSCRTLTFQYSMGPHSLRQRLVVTLNGAEAGSARAESRIRVLAGTVERLDADDRPSEPDAVERVVARYIARLPPLPDGELTEARTVEQIQVQEDGHGGTVETTTTTTLERIYHSEQPVVAIRTRTTPRDGSGALDSMLVLDTLAQLPICWRTELRVDGQLRVVADADYTWPGDASAPYTGNETFDALMERGGREFQAREYAAAIVALERAYALEPDPAILYYIGNCYEGMGDLEAAISATSRAMRDFDEQYRRIAANKITRLRVRLAKRGPSPGSNPRSLCADTSWIGT